MSESEIREPQISIPADHALAESAGENGFVPLVLVAALTGAIVLALVSSGAAEPLLLTLLSTLAMLGAFLVFGFLAGHVRIGERVREDELVKSLTDGLEDGMLVTRLDGSTVYANRSLRELVGSAEPGGFQALDQAFAAHPDAAAALFRLTRAASRREPGREEIDLPATPATYARRLRIAQRPCVVPGHERDLGPMTLWTVTDVTGERAREHAVVRSLEQTLARYDSAPAGFLGTDNRGVVRHINATFLRWLGREPLAEENRALRLRDVFTAPGAELVEAAAEAPHTRDTGFDLDVAGDEGTVLPLRLFARRDAAGGLLITAYPRSAAAEPDSDGAEVRFARFFQSAPFGIATIDADGCLASTNSAFARMIPDGSSSIGSKAADVLCRSAGAETAGALETSLKQALAGTAGAAPIEITVGPQNEFSRRVYVSPLTHGTGTREAAILYVIDATEQKALEAKFAQSSKMEAVGKLAGGIAHDFNNVLTAIIGFSDLLLQTHRPTDPAYKDIKHIQSSANRAAGLVAKLLAFSRRQTLQTEPLLLADVLTDLGPLMKRSIGEKIELRVSAARDLWYVKADKTQLDQVLLNLAFNARDAMPEGGTLSFRARNVAEREVQKLAHHGMAIAEYVLIEVEDTGSGMTPEVMSKIFEPFFTTKGVGKGTGLGLATVYGIVKQSGGFIYPESEVGKGTTFRAYLPRHVPENEDEIVAQKTPKKEQPKDLTGSGRVLLVEDEDIVRSFAVRALKRQGYEVLEASTGVEALEVMEANDYKIDIVVSDVVMPEMDGPTLLKELRKKNPKLKIIFVSGYPHEAFETSLDKDEQFAFLPKPFSLPQLAAKVKEQLALG